jgi:hypothetical protein
MTELQITTNPFALMMHPEAVFAAIEKSERLARLKSRICRPLDKPMGLSAEEDSDESFPMVDDVVELQPVVLTSSTGSLQKTEISAR